MKKLLAVAVVVLPMVLAAQTQHFKQTNDGAFASVSSNTDPLSTFSIQVSRSSSNGTNISFVSETFAPDFSTGTFTLIIGAIPNSAFSGDNTRNLNLNLDTSTLDPTTSTSETCTLDFTQVDPVFTCGPIAPGTIQLSFQENDFQRDRLLALEAFSTIGPVTIHTHQRSDSGSANVQGTILGTAVSSSNATVGVNHMSTLEFIKN